MPRSVLGTLALALALASSVRAQATVETLQASGPPAERLDLVLLAEGYPQAEQARFQDDARRLVAALRQKSPFDRYDRLLNIHAIFAPAAQRGLGTPSKPVATLYGSRFTQDGGRMIQGDLARVQAAALAAKDVDRVLVLCDDDRHGGAAWGTVAFACAAAPTYLDVAIHELGHILGGLADEYGGDSEIAGETKPAAELDLLFMGSPNVSPWTERTKLPWRAWLEPGAKVPAGLFTQGISAFEGAGYRDRGMFRPRRTCCMRTNEGQFCEPCREALVLGLSKLATPTTVDVSEKDGVVVVKVTTASDSPDLRVHAKAGLLTFEVTVEDRTPWVRATDRSPLMTTRRVNRMTRGKPVRFEGPVQPDDVPVTPADPVADPPPEPVAAPAEPPTAPPVETTPGIVGVVTTTTN